MHLAHAPEPSGLVLAHVLTERSISELLPRLFLFLSQRVAYRDCTRLEYCWNRRRRVPRRFERRVIRGLLVLVRHARRATVAAPITANDAYLRWLDEECSAT